MCLSQCGLDSAHYYFSPGLSWDALLKKTGVELELLTDYEQHLFIERRIRGGISIVSKRHAKANNPLVDDYDPEKPSSHILYLDANNLYGWAMSQPLPMGAKRTASNWPKPLQIITQTIQWAFNSNSRYLDDLLNIDNNFFDSMVNRIYPSEFKLNKTNVSDAEASFFHLHFSISDGFVKTKIYDKRDDFDFDIVNFPFQDGDVPRSASYGVSISELIRFAQVSSHVDDFNNRNKVLTAKLLRQGYRYHKLRKAFSKLPAAF